MIVRIFAFLLGLWCGIALVDTLLQAVYGNYGIM